MNRKLHNTFLGLSASTALLSLAIALGAPANEPVSYEDNFAEAIEAEVKIALAEAGIDVESAERAALVDARDDLTDRGGKTGCADQGAVSLGDASDPLHRADTRQRVQQPVTARARRSCALELEVGRNHQAPPSAAASRAERIASICWFTPARTSPASDTTTQLSGSSVSSSTSSMMPTAGCA